MSRYIDADALLEWIKAVWDLDSEWINEIKATAVIKQTISDIEHSPTADVVEVKRGYWKGKPIAGNCTVRCSICGSAFLENDGRWNYCPNCGAKMEGEEE